MKKLIPFLIIILFWSCQNSKPNIEGVWFQVDSNAVDRHYSEAHISDSTFVVVNDVSISYFSSYKWEGDTLVQYLRDLQNDLTVIDSLRFLITVTPDSLTMVNAYNPENYSKWKRIDNLEPHNFNNEDSFDQFVADLKNRYKKLYLEVYDSDNIEANLKDFDAYWN